MLETIKPYNSLPFLGVRLPEIEISESEKLRIGAKPNCDNKEFLTQLCRHGFKEFVEKKIPKNKHQEYIDRNLLEQVDYHSPSERRLIFERELG